MRYESLLTPTYPVGPAQSPHRQPFHAIHFVFIVCQASCRMMARQWPAQCAKGALKADCTRAKSA
jgi:hypothetical protein